ncbi:hypothetical protein Kirov_200 [Bacillus phage Kirov]|uniref:Uncharacterized protein n=1 Tax=Bacillus phage Kirov TaxID=2783539 RepID=A0A7S6RBB5_9CAUD|nr:hypothetical protein PQE67_gp104 [Bacillus phage Kirov]QOV08399.1 hypothetical protein Kirov_200 [Bacillus phage Kirov]
MEVLMMDGVKYVSNDTGEVWILNENYRGDWYLDRKDADGYKKMLSASTNAVRTMLELHYTMLAEPSMEKKAKTYDELYSWYLWLRHRTKNGKVDKQHVETFLKGVKKEFEGDNAE